MVQRWCGNIIHLGVNHSFLQRDVFPGSLTLTHYPDVQLALRNEYAKAWTYQMKDVEENTFINLGLLKSTSAAGLSTYRAQIQ